jgi:hypothetical protein
LHSKKIKLLMSEYIRDFTNSWITLICWIFGLGS